MIVEVVGGRQERPEVRVVAVDDLSRLHLALGEVTDEEADRALRESGLGRLADGDIGFLDAAALRAAAEPLAHDPAWSDEWAAMLASAEEQGRLSDDGTSVRVPVESAAGA